MKPSNKAVDFSPEIKEYLKGNRYMTDKELIVSLNKESYEALYYILHLVTNYCVRNKGCYISPRYAILKKRVTDVREYKRIEDFVQENKKSLGL